MAIQNLTSDIYKVTIEYIPAGDMTRSVTIATAMIEDTVDADPKTKRKNYNATFFQYGSTEHIWKKCRVEKFPAFNKNAWHLLFWALARVCSGDIINERY